MRENTAYLSPCRINLSDHKLTWHFCWRRSIRYCRTSPLWKLERPAAMLQITCPTAFMDRVDGGRVPARSIWSFTNKVQVNSADTSGNGKVHSARTLTIGTSGFGWERTT